MLAQCQCGQLTARAPAPSDQIVACHCIDCQRRSGSPFGEIAYYPASQVELSGNPNEFTRATDAGNTFTNYFCTCCGATVWCRMSRLASAIGIPVGAFGQSDYPAPVRSVWEQSRHRWVSIPDTAERYPRGRA